MTVLSKCRRCGAWLLVMLLLCFHCAVLSVSADDTSGQPGVRTEAISTKNDDCVRTVTGYLVYCEDDALVPTGLDVKIGPLGEEKTDISADPWVTITPLKAPEAETEETDAQVPDSTPQPAFFVDFHRPEDAAAIPAYLYETTVAGETIIALSPFYEIGFAVITADNADAERPLTMGDAQAMGGYTFLPDRPQKLISRLTLDRPSQPLEDSTATVFTPSQSGILSVYCYAPDAIRSLLQRIENDHAALCAQYGYEDISLAIRYTFSANETTADAPSVTVPMNAQMAGGVITQTFSFDDDAFRACFPADTFKTYEKEAEEGAEAVTIYDIDETAVTLSVRASFVVLTKQSTGETDGTPVLLETPSMDTDASNTGAVNSLVADPTAIDAPELTISAYDEAAQQLTAHIDASSAIREAAVWAAYQDILDSVQYQLEISVNGEEWHSAAATPAVGTSLITGGDYTVDLTGEAMTEYAYIRLRARVYTMENAAVPAVVASDWSDSIAYDMRPTDVVTAPPATETLPMYTETTAADDNAKTVCRLCGICPAPYGLCLFLWIGCALLAIVLIVLVVVLIPKRRSCPRCGARCSYKEPSCPDCGYRFVGSIPDIEDFEEMQQPSVMQPKQVPDDAETLKPDDVFFEGDPAALPPDPNEMTIKDIFGAPTPRKKPEAQTPPPIPVQTPAPAQPQEARASSTAMPQTPPEAPQKIQAETAPISPARVTPQPAKESKEAPVVQPAAQKPAAATRPIVLPQVSAAFLAELKRKMAAAKAGTPQTFTPAEIAYIKALREKAAANKQSGTPKQTVPQPAKETQTEQPHTEQQKHRTETVQTARPAQTQPAVPGRFTPEQLERLRALRAEQMPIVEAEQAQTRAKEKEAAEQASAAPKQESGPDSASIKRVPKPPKTIKCPTCAVPNPETNERCYICGHIIKK